MTVAGALVATDPNCTSIPSGRTGVEWALTCGTIDRTLDEGCRCVAPFSRICAADLREQQQE
jgi:hypothetical protein